MIDYKVISPQDSKKLTHDDLSIAKVICEEMRGFVNNRDSYISEHSVDPKFALPDGNWSYDAPNEFLQLFLRVSKCEKSDIENLRALSSMFSGYNLYEQGYTQPLCTKVHRLPPGLKVLNHSRTTFPVSILDG